MSKRTDFMEAFKKALKAAFANPTPINAMDAHDVIYIQQKVHAETGFDLFCYDTRRINGRKNVGIVMPENTPAEKVAKAKEVFIAAAQERGITIEPEQVLRYLPPSPRRPSEQRPQA